MSEIVYFYYYSLAILFLFVGLKTVMTECSHISYVSCLADATVVICCKEHGSWKLLQYDVHNGKEIGRTVLENQPDGITVVTLNGKQCLAMAYP